MTPMGGTPMLGENLADVLGAHPWAVWFGLALLLAVAETLSLDFVLIMLAAGAAAGGVTALVAPGLWWLQLAVAIVVSVGTLLLLRPTLLRRVRALPGYRSGYAAMLGRTGRATAEITATGGVVKIDGQEWSARSYDETMTIAPGTEVEVFELDGAIAVVYPKNESLGTIGLPAASDPAEESSAPDADRRKTETETDETERT